MLKLRVPVPLDEIITDPRYIFEPKIMFTLSAGVNPLNEAVIVKS